MLSQLFATGNLSERKVRFTLFFFFFFLYLLFLGDFSSEPFYSSDEIFYFRLTQSLTEHASLEIEPYLGYTHSKYAPGQSVAGIPAYVFARIISGFFPDASPSLVILYIVHLTNVIIGAWLCVCFLGFALELGYSRRTAIAGALVLGMATTFFPYAKQYFADPLAALALLYTVRFLYQSEIRNPRNALYAGACFGFAVLTKIDSVLLIFPIALAGLWHTRQLPRKALYFAIGLIPFVLLQLLYNHYNYGSVLKPGYGKQAFATPFFIGLFGLLFSPSRGLFLYSPPIILFFIGLGKFRRKFPALFFLCAALIMTKLTVTAKWFSWQGGWCWGPRLLLPVIPLLLLPVLEVFENWRAQKGGMRLFILGLILLGIFVQIVGCTVSPNKFDNDIWGMLSGGMNECLFVPQLSTLRGNLFLLSQGKVDLGWIWFLRNSGVAASILFALNVGAMLFFGGLLLREFGAGEKRWLHAFLPDARKFAIPTALIIAVLFASYVIMRGQGLDTLRYTYIEEAHAPGTKPLPRIWHGYIYAPVEGKYKFALKVLGTYDIVLDKKPLFLSNRDIPQHWDYAVRNLKKGCHYFAGRYTPRTDADIALFHIYWTVPDGAEYKTIISPQYLFRAQPGVMRRMLLGFVRLKSWLILLIILGCAAIRMRPKNR